MNATKTRPKSPKPRLLILSFSDIQNDARVMKQVHLFEHDFEVTTCGWGDAPSQLVEHIRFEPQRTKRTARLQAVFLRLKLYKLAYAVEPDAHRALQLLKGRSFEAVITNDLEGIGVGLRLTEPSRVHADIHEYYPGLEDQSPAWVTLRKPYNEWILNTHATKVQSRTTVSEAIADRYFNEFGMRCGVVHNSIPQQDFTPGVVQRPIAIVHSGAALPNRKIEVMMRAVARTTLECTFDLYLTGDTTAYAQSLRDLAQQLGSRISIHPPKPYAELLKHLNSYDLGIHVLPPVNTNNQLALPNKLFDFVQARLAIIVGPTPEMAQRVVDYGLGAVTPGFSEEDILQTLNKIVPEEVTAWKHNAHQAASALSIESQLPVWQEAVTKIAGEHRSARS